MALSAGTKLGPYEILAPLGAGGMGEVYRARDTRLDRTVAIKILASHLSSSPELKQRFEREAKAISALNHPHICSLYDVGSQDGTDYLVLEFLEGETLAERLRPGALPLKEALKIGMEVSEALEVAHRAGIVHRDLKPGNIMLTKAGAKLMDFGLAKPAEAGLAAGTSGPLLSAAKTTSGPSPMSPLTTAGAVVGTIQYMSPEQIEGKNADVRSDLFALGAVLYEMVTGKRAFAGKSQISVASAILEKDPEPISTTTQAFTPPAFEHVVDACLAKDPDDRFQTAHDVRLELKWIAEGRQSETVALPAKQPRSRERALWALVVLSLAVAVTWTWWSRPPVRVYPIRSELGPLDPGTYDPVISPSGRQIAFSVSGSGGSQIWIRSMDSLQARAVPGTEGADKAFWSPDEQSLGFFGHGKLNKVEIATGSVQALTKVPYGVGGAWGSNGTIVYTPSFNSGLFRISASGGDAQPLTELDGAKREVVHAWPQFLPDGEHILFLQRGATGEAGHISMVSLGSKNVVPLVKGDGLVGYTEPGYILFVRDGSFMAQAFDASRLRLRGDPFPVADKIGYDGNWAQALASVSANGTVVYQEKVKRDRQLIMLDRSGKQVGQIGPAGPYIDFRVSADEKQVAIDRVDPATGAVGIWILDISRGIFSRLTTSPSNNENPAWSPDRSSMVFSSDRNGMYDLYLREASGQETPLLRSSQDKIGPEWTRDGKYVVYVDVSPKTHTDIYAIPMNGERKPFPVVQTEAEEDAPHVSPDGRWLAYQSDESGRFEIYIVSFPTGRDRLQISNSGGSSARWSADGKQLFYISEDRKVTAVEIKSSSRIEASAPKPLFAAPDGDYAVMQDGQRFIFSRTAIEEKAAPVTMIVNWTAGLKK